VEGSVTTLVTTIQVGIVIDENGDALFAATCACNNQRRFTLLSKFGTFLKAAFSSNGK
jgi:hypothetical protein